MHIHTDTHASNCFFFSVLLFAHLRIILANTRERAHTQHLLSWCYCAYAMCVCAVGRSFVLPSASSILSVINIYISKLDILIRFQGFLRIRWWFSLFFFSAFASLFDHALFIHSFTYMYIRMFVRVFARIFVSCYFIFLSYSICNFLRIINYLSCVFVRCAVLAAWMDSLHIDLKTLSSSSSWLPLSSSVSVSRTKRTKAQSTRVK